MTDWPEEIYLLKLNDPVQGGPEGIANTAARQLDQRTQILRAGLVEQGDQITQIVTDLTELTQVVAGSQAEVLANVVQALTGGAGIYNEQFESRWTLIDTGDGIAPLALTDAVVPVAGDDSIDVTSTAKLLVGETYVLFNGAGFQQEVTVAQILGANRIRVSPALTGAVAFPAWLGRTDWDVSTVRQASAQAGGIYRTRPLDLGPVGVQPKALLIRHAGPGLLDVEWQPVGSTDWTDAPWWRRRAVDGQTETQYLIPTNGPTRLRITAIGGPVTVYWIATQPQPAMAEGAYNPHPRPGLTSPAQGDNALGPQPVLQIAAYTPPPGLTVAGVVYEVVKVSDNSVVHTSALQPTGSAYTLPDGVAQQNTSYRFTARIKASDGSLGDPSKPILGATIPDFRVILAPMITSPAASTTVPTGGAITLSPYQVLRGADAQAGVQMQVRRLGAEWSAAWDSGTLPVGTVLAPTAPAVLMGWQVEVRCRYIGATLGAGAWSLPLPVTIDPEIWLTAPGDGVFEIPEDGEYEVIPGGGGASGGYGGGSGGPGGGSGYRPDPVPTKTYTKGQLIPFRVGLGGPAVLGTRIGGSLPNDFVMAGQDSFFGDVVGHGGKGVPFGSQPTDSNGGAFYIPSSPAPGGSSGGCRNALAPGGGLPGSNGWPGDGGYGYLSGVGLRPGAGGVGNPAVNGSGSGGAGGVEPRNGSVSLTGEAYWIGTAAGRIDGATGGKGYGAGGPGAPYLAGVQSTADGTTGRSGSGAHGCIILRKVVS